MKSLLAVLLLLVAPCATALELQVYGGLGAACQLTVVDPHRSLAAGEPCVAVAIPDGAEVLAWEATELWEVQGGAALTCGAFLSRDGSWEFSCFNSGPSLHARLYGSAEEVDVIVRAWWEKQRRIGCRQ